MHDPTRLSVDTTNPLLARVLRAGAAERPRSGALERTLLAVSAGGALTAVGASAVGASAVGASAVATTGVGTVISGAGTSGAGMSEAVASVAGGGGAITGAGVTGAGVTGAGITGAGITGAGITGTAIGGVAASKVATGALLITVGKWAGAGALAIGLSSGAQHWVNVAQKQALHERAQTGAESNLVPRGELPSLAPARGSAVGEAQRPVEFTDPQYLAIPSSVPGTELAPRTKAEIGAGVAELSRPPAGAAPTSELPTNGVAANGVAANERVTGEERRERSTSLSTPKLAEDALALEIALVDRARTSLQARAWTAALDELFDYETKCPRQQLIVEVLVLRMEARLGLHEWSSARSIATRVLQLAGGAPQGVRAREVLAQVSDR